MSVELLAFLKHREHLPKVLDAAQHCRPSSSVWAFSQHVAKEANVPLPATTTILNVLWNIRRGQMLSGETTESLVTGVTDRIEQLAELGDGPWTSERVEEWRGASEPLKAALSRISPDSALMISSKAQSLAYKHENVLAGTRIITDLRPVFDEGATRILEMVVTHSLVIEFADGASAKREIYITMDANDASKLREQCGRAEAKSKIIVESLKSNSWPTIVFPEDSDK